MFLQVHQVAAAVIRHPALVWSSLQSVGIAAKLLSTIAGLFGSVRFSSVQFSSMHFQTTRFSEVLKEVGFEPHRNCPLEMDDLHRCSSRLFRSSKTEASVTEFHCCSWHSKISVFHRTEIGSAREIHRRYADVLEVCSISTSDTVKCKECNLELYLLRHRPPV